MEWDENKKVPQVKDSEDEKTFVLPPLFAYSSRNRPHRVPSYPMPVTEQPVATYSPKVAFDAKLAECISKTVLSLPRTKRQLSALKRRLYLISGHSLFVFMHYYTTKFGFVNPLFENFYANFFNKKGFPSCLKESLHSYYRTNILIAFTATPSRNSPTSPRAKKLPVASHIDTRVPRGKVRPNFLR